MKPQEADDFLKALVSAYVWVASSDEGVSESEFTKFEHLLVESPFATQFNRANVRPYFHDMVAAFEDDFTGAISLTTDFLKAVKMTPMMSEEVIRLCRAAVVGDGDLEQSEENALKEIAALLGINSPV